MGLLSLGRGAAPVGLDIGTGTFRLAQLKPADDKPLLINYASAKAADGLINEGEITNVDGVSKVLASLWRDNNINEKRVVVGVANQKVVVRVIEMPYMSEAELRTAIQYQIGEYIPIPIEEAIIDFQIIAHRENDQQNKVMDVLVVAARRDMIENAIAAVKGAGLDPVIIDVSSLAFARAVMGNEPEKVLPDEPEDKGAIALINISSNLTDIVVIEGEVPRFTRISSMGGDAFTDAIAEQMGVPAEMAEDMKAKIGLPPVDGSPAVGIPAEVSQYKDMVHHILEQEMARFIAEIRRSLDYYVVQATNVKRIEKVIVSGGGAKLKNFLEHLKENLQLDVELGRPLQSIQVKRKMRISNVEDEELSMAICLGLGMRGIGK